MKQKIKNILDRNFTRGDNAKALKELCDLFCIGRSYSADNEEHYYLAQIDWGEAEITVKASNIFEAAIKCIIEYEKIKRKKEDFNEIAGTDISFRIWQAYGDGI